MDNQKMNKKGVTITSVIMIMLLAIALYGGYFLFAVDQFSKNDAVVDDKYNETYIQLLEQQEQLRNQTNAVKDAVNEVREAETGFLVAINGFKGIGASLLLLIGFSDSAFSVLQNTFFSNEIIPPEFQALLIIGLIALVIFAIIAVWMGRDKI